MTALISTKLNPPRRRPSLLRRTRLVQVLDESDAGLILVSAPAGFGKTTLVADWLAGSDLAWGWLSIDAADNDPARFLRYLIAAATRCTDQSADAAALTHGDAPLDADGAIATVLELLASASRSCVLVLDDYHLIEGQGIHGRVEYLVTHLPPHARVAVLTRADPPFPLARLRAAGELAEVRADPLRFTEEEAGTWLCGEQGFSLAADELAQLTTRTEGWAAALQLAAVAMQGASSPRAIAEQFGPAHRFILDYVVEEVLRGLPEETQSFLLRTSILSRLSGPLCDALTEGDGGQQQLEKLEQANLLISALDDERRWYRYHALFAEILAARLRSSDREIVPVLHERAAAWYEARGDTDEAIRHAIAGGGFDRARRLLYANWLSRLMGGEIATVRRWLDALPSEIVRNDAQLSTGYGWSLLLAGSSEGVAERIADAERTVALARGDGFGGDTLPSQLASQRAKLAEMAGNLEHALDHARAALAAIPRDVDPTYGALMRGQATIQIAHILRRQGDLPGAAATYREAMPLFARGGNWLAVARSLWNVARFEIAEGRAASALDLCRSTLAQFPEGSPAVAGVMVATAEALLACGALPEAQEQANEAARLARQGGDRPTLGDAADVLARIAEVRSVETGADAARSSRSGAGGPSSEAPSSPGLIEPLTPRELEFLALVCAGRSNSQIAAELYVTVGTAKAHLHTIYGKLGAANRVEAILRAQELGLAR